MYPQHISNDAEKAMTKTAVETTSTNEAKITRLVFSGGGSKGASYPGAHAALTETGIIDGVTHVAGASAGSFTAAFLALGATPEQLQADLLKTNFANLMGETDDPSWRKLRKDGKPLYDYLHNTMRNLVLDFLSQQPELSEEQTELLQRLREDETQGPTFANLAMLRTTWPNRFKTLTVTAVTEKSGVLKIFNEMDTPHVEIALACRASGSIPVILKPVNIDGVTYVDGGVYDNIPSEYFDKDETTHKYIKNQAPDKTLLFAFLDGQQHEKQTIYKQVMEYVFGKNSLFHALHGSRKDEHSNVEQFNNILRDVSTELFARAKKEEKELSLIRLNELIDEAIDAIKSKNNCSWISHVWAMIVSVCLAIVRYISSFFSKTTALDTTSDNTDLYPLFTIIQEKLKEVFNAVVEAGDADTLTDMDQCVIDSACNIVKELSSDNIHHLGPEPSPILHDISAVTSMAYNYIPKLCSEFNSNYKLTEKMEALFQRIRKDYPLRTVTLSIGDMSAIDFDKATKQARFLSTRGYLDTFNFLTNHGLQKKDMNPADERDEIIANFQKIYSTLAESNNDSLLKELKKPPSKLSSLSKFYLIKEQAESNIDSQLAFALTCTIELKRKLATQETISQEINERYNKRLSFFGNTKGSDSNISTLSDTDDKSLGNGGPILT